MGDDDDDDDDDVDSHVLHATDSKSRGNPFPPSPPHRSCVYMVINRTIHVYSIAGYFYESYCILESPRGDLKYNRKYTRQVKIDPMILHT